MQFAFLRVGFASFPFVILSLFKLVLTLEGLFGSGFEHPSAAILWVRKRTLPFTHTFEKAPGPSEAEGECFILGDRRFTWFAERQMCSQCPLCVIIFPVCPLIIEELSVDKLNTGTRPGMQPGTGTLSTGIVDSSAQKDQELSALGEVCEVTPMVVPIRARLDSAGRYLHRTWIQAESSA